MAGVGQLGGRICKSRSMAMRQRSGWSVSQSSDPAAAAWPWLCRRQDEGQVAARISPATKQAVAAAWPWLCLWSTSAITTRQGHGLVSASRCRLAAPILLACHTLTRLLWVDGSRLNALASLTRGNDGDTHGRRSPCWGIIEEPSPPLQVLF